MATAASKDSPEGQKKKTPSAFRSILAGSTAGAVEIGKLAHDILTEVIQIKQLTTTSCTQCSHYLPCRMCVSIFLAIEIAADTSATIN